VKNFMSAILFVFIFVIFPSISHSGVNEELLEATTKGDGAKIKNLLDRNASVNTKDKDGITPLMRAAHGGHIEAVKLLIGKGADVNAAEKDGYSVLIVTESMPFSSQIEIVKLLIERGANVNAKSRNGWTALMEAAKGHNYLRKSLIDKGHKDVALVPTEFAKLLIEKGADVNAKDSVGRTALLIAAGAGQTETVALLIKKGSDVRAKDISGNTALMYLLTGFASLGTRISKGELKDCAMIPTEIATLLIDRGADVNEKSEVGSTPLMVAADMGHANTVRFLLSRGADVNAKNRSGMTAMKFAIKKGHEDIVQLLKAAGAKE